jgi:hypothetical protein
MASLVKILTVLSGAAILPNDCSTVYFTSAAIPRYDCLALIGDTDSARKTCLFHDVIEGGNDCSPNFFSIVFNPAWFGEVLREFLVGGDAWSIILKHCAATNSRRTSVNR